jgi:hypothetical protein
VGQFDCPTGAKVQVERLSHCPYKRQSPWDTDTDSLLSALLVFFPGSEVVTGELEFIRQARFAAEWNEAQR